MGRDIGSSTLKKSPVLLFQELKNSWFVGSLLNKKPGSIGQIFELRHEAGNVPVGISSGQKDAKGRIIYNEAHANPGESVTLFGNTQLDDKIGMQIEISERVFILFKGKAMSPKKREFNDYYIRVLDATEDYKQYLPA